MVSVLKTGRATDWALCSNIAVLCGFLGALTRFPGWRGPRAKFSSKQEYELASIPKQSCRAHYKVRRLIWGPKSSRIVHQVPRPVRRDMAWL